MAHCILSRRGPSAPARGLTLMELLVALTVVGILSGIAWPGYGALLRRVQRIDAKLALLRIQHWQESHYATHLRYASRLGAAADPDTLALADHSDGGHYLLSLTAAADGQGYAATARAREGGAQARDRYCQRFSVDQTGQRRSADASGIWMLTDPHRCWG